jgi:hypothetical protein
MRGQNGNYRTVLFPFQFGLAITLPMPWPLGTIVLVRSRRRWAESSWLRPHEECHVRQIEEWGAPLYLWRHIWTRVRLRDLYIRDHPIEKECYDAGRNADKSEG